MLSILKSLTERPSPSGGEFNITNYILREISPYAECKIDNLGNIIALKRGTESNGKKIMLAAHMDEVGFIVTGITDDGFLNFDSVGGILTSAMLGKRVKVNGRVGVIGLKAVHLCEKEEREKLPKIDDLYIDIGAGDKADAERVVKPGDLVSFIGEYELFGDGFIKSVALDDKAGVAILIDIIKKERFENDVYFAFTVQEEIGARGAKVAAYSVNPDISIVVEATTASDIADTEELDKICQLTKGAVISFMDRGTVYNKELYNKIISTAKENGINYQIKLGVAGGNDASQIHLARAGVRTAVISIPCRYIHSASCVAFADDIYSVRKLVSASVRKILSKKK